MREATLVEFLKELGLWPLKYSGSSNFKVTCLFSSTKHDGGEDRRPSATVSFDGDDNPSWYNCFGCGTSKPFVEAVNEAAAYHDLKWSRLSVQYRATEDQELQERPLKRMEAKAHKARNYSRSLGTLLKNPYPDDMVEFLDSKGVSIEAAQDAMLAFMPEGHIDDQMTLDEEGDPRPAFADMIIIPTIVPWRGKLRCVGAQARPWKTGVKYYTPYPYESKYYLWGEQWLSEARGQPLFLTEGQFDAIHLRSLGAHAVAIMGVALTRPKVIKLRGAGSEWALAWLDPDAAGVRVRPRIRKALNLEGIPNKIITSDLDPKYCTEEQLKEILDSL